ncbi:MAG: UDP-N-acetylmuramoylalanyl-D-glutamate--2,6-diaminopimelate ligase, partial [Deltaproteobacteria bacterium]|nr:UDP-N-acetylmuramoylalanyl-D-glutamate--2,6-diaminopimelate ligase [Deltaproteobacteria bacterium]
AFGEEAAQIARGALEGGMDPEKVTHTGDRERLKEMVLDALREGDVILVKGSRGMRLETIAAEIEKEWA